MIHNPEGKKTIHIDPQKWSDCLNEIMMEAVVETTFSNRMLIKPRRLKDIAREESDMFINYLLGDHTFTVDERGRDLASAGLGQESILAITGAIRRSYERLREGMSAITFELVETYCNDMLKGYMAGRELEVRKEQERAHEAYIRILEKNS